jgi:ornithine cyclodeaminase/alanine dehydrogenase-like protein (mu-crystallin family)
MVKKMPIQTSGLTILPASDVDAVLDTLDPEVALFSQAAVFTSFSRPSPPPPTSSSPAAAPSVPGVQIPHRLAVQAEDMTMLFMPARAASEGGTACKIVSVPSGGEAEGLPASTVVMDEKTGRVKAVVNARKLTALRNACGEFAFAQISFISRLC